MTNIEDDNNRDVRDMKSSRNSQRECCRTSFFDREGYVFIIAAHAVMQHEEAANNIY